MKVQLLSFPGCRNVEAVRDALHRALAQAGLPSQVEEIDVTGADVPETLRAWGSPTILVDGRDVAEADPMGLGCRWFDAPTERHAGVLRALKDARRRAASLGPSRRP